MSEQTTKPKMIILKTEDIIEYLNWAEFEIDRLHEAPVIEQIKGYTALINKCHKLILDGKAV